MRTAPDETLVTLRGISKTFAEPALNPFGARKRTEALRSVDMDIPAEKVTCLLGPNGAGKTTLVKILASLIVPDRGEIRYGGKPSRIGLVTPNERSFYWRLTGRQNLEFFGALYDLRGKELDRRIAETLEETGMAEFADKAYRLYSAGMKQKLNIARALLGDPSLFLLDEPAAHLDPLAREEFHAFVSEDLVGKRKATVFLCTHDLEEARLLADRIVILDAGRVVAGGTGSGAAGVFEGSRELVIRHGGPVPAGWAAALGDAMREDGPHSLKIRFDGSPEAQEILIRTFVESGGAVREAFCPPDDLLAVLRRKTGRHV